MSNTEVRNKKKFLVHIAAVGLPAALGALNIAIALKTVGPGFPLDDAWIHQTFARNFAETGAWSFQAGSNAGGSTSPLWTLLLAAAYWIKGLQPYIATYILGIFFFAAVVWFGKKSIESIEGNSPTSVWLWIFAAATCWQLIWASGSGMETIFYSALIMVVFFLVIAKPKGWIWLSGLLTGIGVWIRPDALTLMGPVLMVLLLEGKISQKIKNIGVYVIAAAIPFAGYLVWNLNVSGEIFPNTFYAKQAEYASMLAAPFTARLINVFTPVFVGVNILLLPGMVYAAWKSVKDRSFVLTAILIWCLGYGLIYALRLPVSYQHGRYMMPVIAPLMLLGTAGTLQLMRLLSDHNKRVHWITSRVWVLSIALIGTVFLFRGLGQYSQDVKAINLLMVNSAKWIEANTEPSDIIAVHDIGAAGYFGQRTILDLAGLVNPEIIPYIRDEGALEKYITEKKADYLVVLKEWYPILETTGTEAAEFTYTDGITHEVMLIRKLDR